MLKNKSSGTDVVFYGAMAGLTRVADHEGAVVTKHSRHPSGGWFGTDAASSSKPEWDISTSTKVVPLTEQAAAVMQRLIDAMDGAREMLSWPDDWDGEGSPGYRRDTWLRARNFLLRSARRLWEDRQTAVQPPRVRPGPEGSIDLRWRNGARELLVNISAEADEPATYYGDDPSGAVTKGQLNLGEDNHWLLVWLAK